jgi:5-deoxy-glucuronate isomerase
MADRASPRRRRLPGTPPDDGLAPDITVLEFDAGERATADPVHRERVLVILHGRCRTAAAGEHVELRRADGPMDGLPAGWFLPAGTACAVEALERSSVAVLSVEVAGHADGSADRAVPASFGALDVLVEHRGAAPWRREVRTLPGGDSIRRLLAGETVAPAGGWSTFPPHRHSRDDGEQESRHQEVFLFHTRPAGGFALFRVYEPGEYDEALTIRDGDVVQLAEGFHTVVAAPGYDLYYLWGLSGAARTLSWLEDAEVAAAAADRHGPGVDR